MDDIQEYQNYQSKIISDPWNVKTIFDYETDQKILHINIRSVRKNFELLETYLDYLNQYFQIIILTETWHSKYNVDNFQLAGYKAYYTTTEKTKGTGIIAFVKSEIQVVSNQPNIGAADILQLTCASNNFNFTVVCVYRSPSDSIHEFLHQYKKYISSIREDTVVIAGDMNINIQDATLSTHLEYLDIMAENGYMSCINKPTRETDISSTCIDHIFFKCKKKINFQTAIIHVIITDHHATAISLSSENLISTPLNTGYTKINYNSLLDFIKDQDWTKEINQLNVNTALETLIEKIMEAVNKSKTTIQKNSRTTIIKKWMTPMILASVRKKNKLYKQYKKNPTNIEFQTEFKKIRNSVNIEIKKAKENYYKQLFISADKDIKKKWKIFNNITSNTNEQNLIPDEKKIDSEDDLPNQFNNHFVNIGQTLTSNLQRLPTEQILTTTN